MKNLIHVIISIFLFSTLLSMSVLSQEEAKYNFGSAQQTSKLTVSPGATVSTKLYFYNVFGNRITHISLSAEELPKGWSVTFDPLLHDVTVNISGVMTTIEENLNVEPPSDVFETKPETAPEGIEFISSPIGYIGAKPVVVTFSMPETERLGTSHNITIIGTAEYLGQTGTAAIKQTRGFDYAITVVAEEFTEEIVSEVEALPEITEEAPAQTPLSRITGFFVVNPTVTTLLGVIVVLIGAITYLLFFKR